MGPDLQFQVELRGFEPLTPSMRTRCATGLRYSPWNGCQPSKGSGLSVRSAALGSAGCGFASCRRRLGGFASGGRKTGPVRFSRRRRGWQRRCTGHRAGH
jgi:hypothetical protein